LSPEGILSEISKLIPSSQLDNGLAAKVFETLKIGTKDGKVTDVVLEEMSKYVEVQLRAVRESFTDERLDKSRNYGLYLVDALRDCGLIRDVSGDSEPIYHLLRWYFGERNDPHHKHDTYEMERFITYWLISNRILLEFNHRKTVLERAVYMEIALDPAECAIGTFFTVTAKITRPTDGTLVERGNVQAITTFNNGSQRAVPMNFLLSERNWSAQISTSGATPGGFNVAVVSLDENDKFISKNPARGRITVLLRAEGVASLR
jgi:hypothetical protein